MILIKHELRQSFKSLLIWSISVGLICYGCILLYKRVAGQFSQMADVYKNMGDLTKAMGMDKISITTLNGYFATEIVLMFGLGSAMFASMMGASSLAKEEEGHTSEFLFTLPFRRSSILAYKLLALILSLMFFNAVCIGLEALAVWQIDLDFSWKYFLTYHALAFLMQLEIASLAFAISALSSKKQIGLSIGLVLILYVMDIFCRIIPDIKNLKYWTPYYLANGSDVFTASKINGLAFGISLALILFSLLGAFLIYERKDLTA